MSLGEAAEYVSRAECRVAVDIRKGVWSLLRQSGEAAECLISYMSGAVSLGSACMEHRIIHFWSKHVDRLSQERNNRR